MNKYRVVVYAISKNEEKFAERWVNSMNEADDIYVLDTGSTDNTVKILKSKGVIVKTKKIKPWRFDVARNESLKMIPDKYDIYVCTDLDEEFLPGWRDKLESRWQNDTTRARYNYNWQLDENNNPLVNFYIEKIHIRNGYHWTHPVHEILSSDNKENFVTINEITLNHFPDSSKSRSSYLPLLELSVQEDPDDDRNMHYLGREYMYYKEWNKCIDTLIKHLKMPNSTWKDERCASMRFIARSYKNLDRIDEARMWLDKAILETPYLRDPYIERALLEYDQKNWSEVIYYIEEALKIKKHTKSYINEIFSWDHTPYDLLSIAYFYVNKPITALNNIKLALEFLPEDERLLNNKKIIENSIKK